VWRAFARLLTTFDRNKLEPAIALRNAFGVAVPLAVGVLLQMPLGGIAVASGALQVAYSDGHDPYSRRAFRMLASTILCSLAVVIGGLCGRFPILVDIAVAIWGFAAGFVVLLGSDAESLGLISLVTLIIFAAQPLTVERALNAGALAFAGGLMQTLLSISLWPISRREPERRALAKLYEELSLTAVAAMSSKEAPPATVEITQAQDELARLGRDPGPEAQRLWALLNQAERLRLGLLTLGRLRNRLARQSQQPADLEIISQFLQVSSKVLHCTAEILVTHKTPPNTRDEVRAVQQIAERYRLLDGAKELNFIDSVRISIRRQFEAIAGQLRAALGLATNRELSQIATTTTEAMPNWRERLRDDVSKLRANVSLESPAFRHAVRLSATLALGEVMAHAISARRSYWLPLTISLVMKPEFSVTISRGLLRIAGTIVGLLVATGLFHFLHPLIGMEVVLVGLFVFLVRWIGPANYGIFAINVSALVVLLVAFTGVSPKDVILARGLMTTIGGVTALTAYLIWPTWEARRISEVLARMLDSYRRYFRVVVDRYVNPGAPDSSTRDRARLEARRSRSQLEALVDRLRLEPLANAKDLAALNAMLASSHRFINATMALEGAHDRAELPSHVETRKFAQDVEKTLEMLARMLRGESIAARDLPDLREDHHALLATLGTEKYPLLLDETDRITNSLNTLREQLLAWRPREPSRKAFAEQTV
jgi:uncharacterized membrane protein YccC